MVAEDVTGAVTAQGQPQSILMLQEGESVLGSPASSGFVDPERKHCH